MWRTPIDVHRDTAAVPPLTLTVTTSPLALGLARAAKSLELLARTSVPDTDPAGRRSLDFVADGASPLVGRRVMP